VARLGGRPVTVIGARPGDRDVPAVWLDADYGIVRIVTRERLPNGARLLDLTFSEHRPLVGGLYFPYRQEVFVDGRLLVLFTVRSVAINTNPADALFDPASLRSPSCTSRFSARRARSRPPPAIRRRSSSSGPRAPCCSTAAEARPNFADRLDAKGGRSMVYSSDTRPCDAVVTLARGPDTLIHDATFSERDRCRVGSRVGAHSTAAEAGEVAARAGVRRLILTHIEAEYHDEVDLLAEEARKRFAGEVEIARELVPYPL